MAARRKDSSPRSDDFVRKLTGESCLARSRWATKNHGPRDRSFRFRPCSPQTAEWFGTPQQGGKGGRDLRIRGPSQIGRLHPIDMVQIVEQSGRVWVAIVGVASKQAFKN